jgi:hypothetical protein
MGLIYQSPIFLHALLGLKKPLWAVRIQTPKWRLLSSPLKIGFV